MRTHARRRGFSLVEAVVVVILTAFLSSAAVMWYSTTSNPAADTTAKTTLTVFSDMQAQGYLEGRGALDITQLAIRDVSHQYTAAASTRPTLVSVDTTMTTVVSGAVTSSSGACWYVRINFEPSEASGPPTAWYVDTDPLTCTATDVAGFELPDPASPQEGATPSYPIQLVQGNN